MLNFDANWYAYLFNDERREAFNCDRVNVRAAGVEDHESYSDANTMEDISLCLPMGRLPRPQWDINCLSELGFSEIFVDTTVGQRVWNPEEKLNYASSPGFMIRATK